MAELPVRLQVIEAAMVLGLIALVGRAAQVQLIQGSRWSTEARVQRTQPDGGSAERRAGYECRIGSRSRWSPYH